MAKGVRSKIVASQRKKAIDYRVSNLIMYVQGHGTPLVSPGSVMKLGWAKALARKDPLNSVQMEQVGDLLVRFIRENVKTGVTHPVENAIRQVNSMGPYDVRDASLLLQAANSFSFSDRLSR
jgi:hypothetical protein